MVHLWEFSGVLKMPLTRSTCIPLSSHSNFMVSSSKRPGPKKTPGPKENSECSKSRCWSGPVSPAPNALPSERALWNRGLKTRSRSSQGELGVLDSAQGIQGLHGSRCPRHCLRVTEVLLTRPSC